jgi:hypothetical protein
MSYINPPGNSLAGSYLSAGLMPPPNLMQAYLAHHPMLQAQQGYLAQHPAMQRLQQLADITRFGGDGGAAQIPGSFGNIARMLPAESNYSGYPTMWGGEEGWGVPQMGAHLLQYTRPPANQE